MILRRPVPRQRTRDQRRCLHAPTRFHSRFHVPFDPVHDRLIVCARRHSPRQCRGREVALGTGHLADSGEAGFCGRGDRRCLYGGLGFASRRTEQNFAAGRSGAVGCINCAATCGPEVSRKWCQRVERRRRRQAGVRIPSGVNRIRRRRRVGVRAITEHRKTVHAGIRILYGDPPATA